MNQTLLETRVSDKSADFVWSGPVRVVEFGTYSAGLRAIKYWETQNIPFVCVLFSIGSTFPTGFSSSKHSSPVSEWPRTTVSVGALHPGLQCRHAATSAFRQPSPTCRTAFPAQHIRSSGIFSCWPDGLELTRGFYPGSNEQHRLF